MTARGYLHPMRTYVVLTLLMIGVLSTLYFVMGIGPDAQGTLPPSFAFGASDLYFHAIAIGMASLGVYLVVLGFDLNKYEPSIDFPLSYRALLATMLASVGGLLYLRPVFNVWLAPIPLGLILLGMILLADVGGALLVELYLLPAKLSSRYDPSQNRLGMIPKWSSLPSWQDLRKMDGTYWLTFTTVVSAFIFGVTGFVVFWLNYLVIDVGVSPAILNGYIDWLGGASNFLGNAMGAHSHAIVMALMLGAVAVVAKRFHVLDLAGWKRRLAKVGLWVAGTGTAALTAIFVLEAYTTAFPGAFPGLWLASDPGGPWLVWSSTAANGMAVDDTMMLWAALGAMILLVPLLYTRINGSLAWQDPVRMAILGTWIFAFIATPIEGFYIEFNEATLAGAPPDVVFGALQYFALIGITLVCMALLAVDFYQDRRGHRRYVAAFATFATLLATAGGYYYVFYSTGDGSLGYWAFSVGFLLMDLALIVGMIGVYLGRAEKVATLSPETAPAVGPPARIPGEIVVDAAPESSS